MYTAGVRWVVRCLAGLAVSVLVVLASVQISVLAVIWHTDGFERAFERFRGDVFGIVFLLWTVFAFALIVLFLLRLASSALGVMTTEQSADSPPHTGRRGLK